AHRAACSLLVVEDLRKGAPILHTLSALLAWRKHDAARWTLGYYLLFLCLGLDTAVLGPTLPTLAEQTHTPLGRMGWLFLAGAVGYTSRATLGGGGFRPGPGAPGVGSAPPTPAPLQLPGPPPSPVL